MFQQKDTALIGLIVMGASASIEKAFHKNVPDRVQITTTRVPFGEVSYNGFLEVTRKLPDAASLLMLSLIHILLSLEGLVPNDDSVRLLSHELEDSDYSLLYPVSYTHLDVYKRQVHQCACKMD